MWYAIHSAALKSDDLSKLLDDEWKAVMDLVDIFCLIVPLTKALEQGGDPGIAHVFLQLLALLKRQFNMVPDRA